VIADGDRAFAILGPVGAGKSTTAAALALKGCGIVSEDVAPIISDGECFRAIPGYFRIRLWPQSSSILFGSSDYLPKLVSNWNKCYLDLENAGYRHESQDLPLSAIYLLQGRIESDRAPYLEPILPREALVALVTNTYMNYVLDEEQRAHEFAMLGQLLGTVRMLRVVPSANPELLDSLCRLLLDDFRSFSGGRVAS
jgi:hypothetical protein